MTRYRTRNYVATSENEAKRLASVDGTSWDKVKITHDVDVVHSTYEWALWSDGTFTTAIGLDEALRNKVKSITPDAESFIDTIRSADGGEAHFPGGLLFLTEVESTWGRRVVDVGPSRGVYHRPIIEAINVRLRDGSEHTWYTYSEGYPEGYTYQLWPDLDSLVADLRKQEEANRKAMERFNEDLRRN